MVEPELNLSLQGSLPEIRLDLKICSRANVIGLFGPSGAGKTTLLETIAGLRPRPTGHIRVKEETWLDTRNGINLPAHLRSTGYVPQDYLLFPHWTVKQNLLAGARRKPPGENPTHGRSLSEVADILGLAPLLQRAPVTLSGGEKQRVALGRALLSGPQLLLLDEPVAALDAHLRYRIVPFLRKIRSSFGTPMVIVSHHPADLIALCDEVFALEKGRIVASGPPLDVFGNRSVYRLLSPADELENILPGTVESRHDRLTSVKLGPHPEAPCIQVAHLDQPPQTRVELLLGAQQIILTRKPLERISARNQLSGKLVGISRMGVCDIASVHLNGTNLPPLLVEITDASARELALQAGGTVCAVFKTSAVRAIPS